MTNIKIKKTNKDIFCPYCGSKIEEVLYKSIKMNALTTKPIYACSNCKKVLPAPNAI